MRRQIHGFFGFWQSHDYNPDKPFCLHVNLLHLCRAAKTAMGFGVNISSGISQFYFFLLILYPIVPQGI